jgi:hypothetical protein
MKRFLASLPLAIGLSLLYVGVAYAQGEAPSTETAETVSIAAKLAGLVAAAAVVERIIETGWDFYENNVLAASRLVGNAQSYVRWAQEQVQAAKSALVSGSAAGDASELEKAFERAEQRLNDYLKSPVYISMKKKISMPVGIVLGVVVAYLSQLQMFSLLDILEPGGPLAGVDMLITGLIIGTGSAPVHSLIGILQNTKDAVDAARALYTGKAISEVTDAIKQLETRQTTVTERKGILQGAAETEVTYVETTDTPLKWERSARRMLRL